MARVVDVLYLFSLPMTSGAVGVLEGRQYAPGDALGRPHYPLESPAVVGGAVAVPGGDSPHCVGGPFQIVSYVEAEELEAFHLIRRGLVNVDRVVLPLLFSASLFCLALRERLFSWHHSVRSLTC